MTCKDCLHFEVCEFEGVYFEDVAIEASASDGIEDLCPLFENKADFVEVNRAVIGAIQLAQDEIREYRKRNGLDPVWEFSPERLRQVAQTARSYMTEGENDDTD